MDPTLKGFVTSVEVPVNKPVYSSRNGVMSYYTTTRAEIIEIPIKIRVDEKLYYGQKIFSGSEAIQVTMYKAGILQNTVSMEVKAIGDVNIISDTRNRRTFQ
jgi:hypothetical protein